VVALHLRLNDFPGEEIVLKRAPNDARHTSQWIRERLNQDFIDLSRVEILKATLHTSWKPKGTKRATTHTFSIWATGRDDLPDEDWTAVARHQLKSWGLEQ